MIRRETGPVPLLLSKLQDLLKQSLGRGWLFRSALGSGQSREIEEETTGAVGMGYPQVECHKTVTMAASS